MSQAAGGGSGSSTQAKLAAVRALHTPHRTFSSSTDSLVVMALAPRHCCSECAAELSSCEVRCAAARDIWLRTVCRCQRASKRGGEQASSARRVQVLKAFWRAVQGLDAALKALDGGWATNRVGLESGSVAVAQRARHTAAVTAVATRVGAPHTVHSHPFLSSASSLQCSVANSPSGWPAVARSSFGSCRAPPHCPLTRSTQKYQLVFMPVFQWWFEVTRRKASVAMPRMT